MLINGLPEIGGISDLGEKEYSESDRSTKSSQHIYGNGGIGGSASGKHRNSDWIILEGLRGDLRYEGVPSHFEGFLLKRRKWPLKGWHKRYFYLEKGILKYAKTPVDISKGKSHGSIDIGLSMISTKSSSRRIDIDTDECIYHIKVKNKISFDQWVQQLRHHRHFRQHQIMYQDDIKKSVTGLETSVNFMNIGETSSTSSNVSTSKVANWLLDSNGTQEEVSQLLDELHRKLVRLSSVYQEIELGMGSRRQMPDIDTGSLKKYRHFMFRRTKKNHSSITSKLKVNKRKANLEIPVIGSEESTELHDDAASSSNITVPHLSSSHPSLNESESTSNLDNQGLKTTMTRSSTEVGKTGATSGNPGANNGPVINVNKIKSNVSTALNEEYLSLAEEIHDQLRLCLRKMRGNRDNSPIVPTTVTEETPTNVNSTPTTGTNIISGTTVSSTSTPSSVISNLKLSLQKSLDQNRELRQRLNRIHEDSDTSSIPQINLIMNSCSTANTTAIEEDIDEPTLVHQPIGDSKSYESCSVLSLSEYYDAAERFSTCTSSTDEEDDRSVTTDLSEEETSGFKQTSQGVTGRRSKLPCPKPETGDISLWSLLCKNIGKDLSKISMPVTLNEPLNVLQRLCEELEYSELLDEAAAIDDPCEQMLYVAAFAVSAYSGSAYRAGHKPFNPLLGETYECIRNDKGFRFIAEQVSHHPPISACHAESENYVFWQGMRIKTKFWGKSMEIIPFGNVNVLLKRTKSLYRWNKVTTCVHNIFKGQRYVDQYGEMIITNGDLKCKLTFSKTSYWSNKRHEVFGTIVNKNGEVIKSIFGKWTEALYTGSPPQTRCIWRPGAMPDDYKLYYGFTRFALELNELTPDLVNKLPITDTRFRPDQRLLEEGKIQKAENIKMVLEQLQRERRKEREEKGEAHKSRWFKQEPVDELNWISNDEYWMFRDGIGFTCLGLENLWPEDVIQSELSEQYK
ncbi:oxysterol-binding protein-related protein 7-like isoform X2 [Panonychus citri]|nr:oxysterol-binding protein-related protein 7-like isoform X2 [Panonychus citri]XP_053205635.1 oxysterol-binding protein-related protein 7-like isoform X2 [Panonychus citri]XP_053205636.1 oxysterol-binding protein-related protein 7-like isoform X2 [Panonychus citri]